MTNDRDALREQQIDNAARYLRETLQAGKKLTDWSVTLKATKRKWIDLARGALDAAALSMQPAPDGWVLVPREILEDLANCDGTSQNVVDAPTLAKRVRLAARTALAAAPPPPSGSGQTTEGRS